MSELVPHHKVMPKVEAEAEAPNALRTGEQAGAGENQSGSAHALGWKHLASEPMQLLFVAMIVFLWLQLIQSPFVPVFAKRYLDVSWHYSNGYFLKHSWRAGVDYIFPTGLLAFFYRNVYDGSLFRFQWAWEIILSGFITAKIVQICLRYPAITTRIGIVVASAMFLSFLDDAVYYLLLLIIATFLLDTKPRKPLAVGIDVALLVALSFLKFSFLIMSGQIIAFAVIAGGARRSRSSLALLAAYLLGCLSLWLLLGQRLSDLPAYFKNTTLMSAAYMQAMGVSFGESMTFLGVLVLAALAYLVWQINKDSARRNVPLAALFALFFLQIYKHGFVRNDTHPAAFFGSIIAAFFLAPVAFGAYRPLSRKCRTLVAASLIACWFGVNITLKWPTDINLYFWRHTIESAKFVFMPNAYKQDMEARYAEEARIWNLPRINAIVGNSTIDVPGYSQFIAFLNGWNFASRPVYQSYCAFSPYLLKLNGDFYRGANAPRYVLLRLETIDGRPPMLDDSDALSVLWQQYHPVAVEKGFLLLTRNTQQPTRRAIAPSLPAKALTQTQRVAQFWEHIPLDDGAQWHLVSLQIKPTLAGKIRSAVLRPNPTYLITEMTDGTTDRFLLPTEMAKCFFLIDPVLKDTHDALTLYGGAAKRRVHSFLVLQYSRNGLWAENRVEINILSGPSQIGQPLSSAEMRELLLPEQWQSPGSPSDK